MTDFPEPPSSRPTPGWYPDPSAAGMERWWDGEQWSDRSRPAGGPPGGWASAPGGGTGAPAGDRPPNYLVQAILTTLFCCLPFGIVAIVKAAQVNSLWGSGQAEAAQQASAEARKWCWVAFGVGLVVIAVYFAIGMASADAATGGAGA